jgi:hypothetical protein
MKQSVKVICVTFLVSNAYAEEEIIGDFFQSGTVYQMESKKMEMSFATQFSKNAEHTRFEFPIALEYGITEQLQAGITWMSFVRHSPEHEKSTSGLGDSGIDVQYVWQDIGKKPFHSAVGLNVNIATGDEGKGLGEGETILEPYFILATNSVKNAHISLQSGIKRTDEEISRFANFGVFTTTNPVAVALEYNWTKAEKYITTGITWQSTDSWNVGVGIPVGLNEESDDFRVILTSKYGFD